MAIKKRLTQDQRLKKVLPKGWREALHHPLLKKLCYGDRGFNATPQNISDAIKKVKLFRGASYEQKVFVLALDIVLEKAFGTSVLEPDAYNRLQQNLANNEDKMQQLGLNPWHVYMWDIYHDSYGLGDMDVGDLVLPKLKRIVLKRPKSLKKKHRRIIKGK